MGPFKKLTACKGWLACLSVLKIKQQQILGRCLKKILKSVFFFLHEVALVLECSYSTEVVHDLKQITEAPGIVL